MINNSLKKIRRVGEALGIGNIGPLSPGAGSYVIPIFTGGNATKEDVKRYAELENVALKFFYLTMVMKEHRNEDVRRIAYEFIARDADQLFQISDDYHNKVNILHIILTHGEDDEVQLKALEALATSAHPGARGQLKWSLGGRGECYDKERFPPPYLGLRPVLAARAREILRSRKPKYLKSSKRKKELEAKCEIVFQALVAKMWYESQNR